MTDVHDPAAARKQDHEALERFADGFSSPRRSPVLHWPSEQGLEYEDITFPALDGVPRYFVFFRITLPMLTPYMITAALFRLLDSIQQFDIIYPMTQGGPGDTLLVFQVRAYLEFYSYTNVGKSAALLMILWAITYALSNIFIKQWLKLRERARGLA